MGAEPDPEAKPDVPNIVSNGQKHVNDTGQRADRRQFRLLQHLLRVGHRL